MNKIKLILGAATLLLLFGSNPVFAQEPLQVTEVNPPDGAMDVPLLGEVTLYFSNDLNSSTVTSDTIFLTDYLGNRVPRNLNVFGTSNGLTGVQMTRVGNELLAPGERYTAHVTTGVEDGAGNTLPVEFTSTFTTIAPQTLAVTEVNPPDGAMNVPLLGEVTLYFSNDLNSSTVTSDTIFMTDYLGNRVPRNLDVFGTSNGLTGVQMTRVGNELLAPGERYTLHVTTGVEDGAGNTLPVEFNSAFTTIAPQTLAVTEVNPPDGAMDVPLLGEVTLYFSNDLNSSTVTSDTIFMTDYLGNRVPRNLDVFGTSNGLTGVQMTRVGNELLAPGERYTLHVTTGVEDGAGNTLPVEFNSAFTTIAPQTLAVTEVNPPDGAMDVPLLGEVTLYFSNDLNSSTVTSDTIFMTDYLGNRVPRNLDVFGTSNGLTGVQMTRVGNELLAPGERYTVHVTTGVEDGAGNTLPVEFNSTFTTRPPSVLYVLIDIKPGSDRNSVNPRSNGVIPVAVLGSMEFDATQIDFSTVRFGIAGASPAHDGHVKDVNDDGYPDMVFHFKTRDTGIICGDTKATLMGETFGSINLTGTDTVKTVGCK